MSRVRTSRMPAGSRGASGQRGFSLIEVLIAVIVLAVGLLGVAALQVQGVRYNYGSFSRSQAVVLANDLAERMHANRPGANAGGYAAFDTTAAGFGCGTVPTVCAAEIGTAAPNPGCAPAGLASYDDFVLACGLPVGDGTREGGVLDLLPSGQLAVSCIADNGSVSATCPAGSRRLILVSWSERQMGTAGTSSAATQTFQLVVQP